MPTPLLEGRLPAPRGDFRSRVVACAALAASLFLASVPPALSTDDSPTAPTYAALLTSLRTNTKRLETAATGLKGGKYGEEDHKDVSKILKELPAEVDKIILLAPATPAPDEAKYKKLKTDAAIS